MLNAEWRNHCQFTTQLSVAERLTVGSANSRWRMMNSGSGMDMPVPMGTLADGSLRRPLGPRRGRRSARADSGDDFRRIALVIMVRRRSRRPRATDNGSSERIRHASGAARAMNRARYECCASMWHTTTGLPPRGGWFQGLV